jgi:hypothetical protein
MREGGWPSWVAVGLAMISAVLVIADFVIAQHNRDLQIEVNQRQQFINESIQLGRLNEALVRTIASAAVSANDDKLRALLAQHGINISVNPAGAAAAPQSAIPAPTPAPKKRR